MNVRMRWYVVLSTPLTTDLSAYGYFSNVRISKRCEHIVEKGAHPSWIIFFGIHKNHVEQTELGQLVSSTSSRVMILNLRL